MELGLSVKVTGVEQTGRDIAVAWPWQQSMTGQVTTTPAQILHPFNGDNDGGELYPRLVSVSPPLKEE